VHKSGLQRESRDCKKIFQNLQLTIPGGGRTYSPQFVLPPVPLLQSKASSVFKAALDGCKIPSLCGVLQEAREKFRVWSKPIIVQAMQVNLVRLCPCVIEHT
jgi:hypothetical protein